MKIAGRSAERNSSSFEPSCFNGAGDEDRRKVADPGAEALDAPEASTEPAMKIAGRGLRLPPPCTPCGSLQRSRR